jgi:hypothetical protein
MKIFMRGHKQDYFIILLAGMLLIIVFAIVYIIFTQSTPSTKTTPPPTSPTIIEPTITVSDNNPVFYDYAAEDRLAKKIQNRPTLSPTDTQSKTTMLNTILHGFNSGVLYETDNVRIEYVQSADLFMGEIKTVNIVKAKSEASTFFLNKGLSQQGVCDLPLMFFLDPEISQQLQGQDVIFSPLPNGC